MTSKVGFVKTTAWFSLIGLFIPGFTAIVIIGLQSMISFFGFECTIAWNLLWSLTVAGSIALPWVFFRFIQRTSLDNEALRRWLFLFNLVEYTLLQASIASLFTNGQTLCYVTDGQNGLEFVYTAWLTIPILLGLSIIYQQVQKVKLKQIDSE